MRQKPKVNKAANLVNKATAKLNKVTQVYNKATAKLNKATQVHNKATAKLNKATQVHGQKEKLVKALQQEMAQVEKAMSRDDDIGPGGEACDNDDVLSGDSFEKDQKVVRLIYYNADGTPETKNGKQLKWCLSKRYLSSTIAQKKS